MQTPLTKTGRQQGVRLVDVDIAVRRRYGQVLLNRALKEMVPIAAVQFAAELHAAVEYPSETVYWVPAEAAQRVLG